MQSKGKLGSIVAGVIAVFLVLVCLFYLSFTFVTSKHETKAQQYALQMSGNGSDSIYNAAYKHYMDSLNEEPVYLGYTLNEVRKWGVGLGLDLKGGMNVTLQVDMPEMLRSMATNATDSTFEQALRRTNEITHQDPDANYVNTFVAQYEKLDPQVDFSTIFNNVKVGTRPDQVAGILRADVKDRVETSATSVLRKRIDQFGVVSPNIQVLQGKDGQILLELPGVKDHERVRELLQRSANLEFYETYANTDVLPYLSQLDQALAADSLFEGASVTQYFTSYDRDGSATVAYVKDDMSVAKVNQLINSSLARRILPSDLKLRWSVKPEIRTYQDDKGNPKEVNLGYALYALKSVNGRAALDGSTVVDAGFDYNDKTNGNEVTMRMNGEGAQKWARITQANIGHQVAILLDDQVYSAPNVNSAIPNGSSSITGDFTTDEARDLANVLKSGKMTATVHIISDMVVGPSLGAEAIHAGIISFIVALVLLMIFMCVFYGIIPGLIANFCLICNLFFTFGILASFQAVLTMSGIAGIVLALGMAVDANVLIYERAKEELRAGKPAKTAITEGYSNAFSAIFDSNLTSIITGVILLFFGTGPIKGFATTLIIGIVCSFFTAVYLSRLFFIWGQGHKWLQNLTFTTPVSRKMFVDAHVNFLGQRKVSFTIVAILICTIVASLFIRGLNQGIDFSGGRNYVVKFDQPVSTTELQKALQPQFPGASTSVITIESSNQVRVSTNYKVNDDGKDVEKEITGKLFTALQPYLAQDMTPEQFSTYDASRGIVSSQKVGPSIANDMRNDAYIAVVLALIAMFLYILLRFHNVAFSVGALAAVAFTAFLIIGFYSFFYGILPFTIEIDQTFIAAILTVIGYQINDTVVVFDRVRENIGLYPKQPFFDLVNRSINSTLGRTIMTSLSTLLVLLCIFILGGEAIRAFTFAMIAGVVFGTMATIWVACPVAYIIDARRRASGKKVAVAAK